MRHWLDSLKIVAPKIHEELFLQNQVVLQKAWYLFIFNGWSSETSLCLLRTRRRRCPQMSYLKANWGNGKSSGVKHYNNVLIIFKLIICIFIFSCLWIIGWRKIHCPSIFTRLAEIIKCYWKFFAYFMNVEIEIVEKNDTDTRKSEKSLHSRTCWWSPINN